MRIFLNMSQALVFDLETQKSFDEVGGRGNCHLLKMSVGCFYDYGTSSFVCYTENEVNDLIDHLFSAKLVVGFNIKAFDYKVLKYYTDKDFSLIPKTLDILEDVHKELGFRVSLNSLAVCTLSNEDKKIEKSADGLQALKWFKEGKIEKIKEYCAQDVLLTRDLYEYGKEKGYLYYRDAKTKERCKVRALWYSERNDYLINGIC